MQNNNARNLVQSLKLVLVSLVYFTFFSFHKYCKIQYCCILKECLTSSHIPNSFKIRNKLQDPRSNTITKVNNLLLNTSKSLLKLAIEDLIEKENILIFTLKRTTLITICARFQISNKRYILNRCFKQQNSKEKQFQIHFKCTL